MTNVKSLLEMYVKMGGSLTDTYSDIAGGIPVGQYSLISDAVLACSKKYSSGGGAYTLPTASASTKGGVKIGSGLSMDGEVLSATGGAEKFVVNITDNAGVTSDKTIAEIVSAKEAGKDVVANVYNNVFGVTAEIPLIYALAAPGGQGYVVMFSAPVPSLGASIGENIYTVYGLVETGSDDVWNSDRVAVGGSTNAPLIVTMTEDEQNSGTYVGDKTFADARTAHAQGRNVVIVLGDSSNSVLSVAPDGSRVALYFAAADSISAVSGNPTDNITITMN